MHLNCGSADANVHDFLPLHLANAQRSQRFPQRHDARPSSHARLSTHRRNPSKVQTNPSAGSCTWDPVSAFSSSASVDWVKVTDGEFFQTDSRPIMPFDGVCNLCNGEVRFVRDNNRNRSHGPLRFLLRFPPFLR
ncbi:DCC family protein At1g52590, chloroplastic-like [Zingiber officinale]|uniref:DCC family protein At1g52590, chloroplastic-like n=1 Tax=Zingiber officinale TaxID=94328 RepID=UPI001C4B38A8|nr:DCC family protein At1g52590, chloroplastic-like [Zingiber officinale]